MESKRASRFFWGFLSLLTIQLTAKLERGELAYFSTQAEEVGKRLFNEFKDLDTVTFQNKFKATSPTDVQTSVLLDMFLDHGAGVRDLNDKVLFLAGKVKHKSGYTLLWAYDKHDRPMIEKMLSLGYNISDALRMAVQVEGVDLIPTLLKEGATVDRETIARALRHAEFETIDKRFDDSKEQEAIHRRNQERKKLRAVLPQLLKKLKNINERDRVGKTLLFTVVRDKELAAMLIKAGIDLDARDNRGATLLQELVDRQPGLERFSSRPAAIKRHKEAFKRHQELIAYLVQQGADPTIKAKSGDSALSLAKEEGLTDLVALFEKSKSTIPNMRRARRRPAQTAR